MPIDPQRRAGDYAQMNPRNALAAAGTVGARSPDYALTPEGIDSLQDELGRLRAKRTRIDEDATIQEEEHMLDARIASLEEVLGNAWVVDPSMLEQDVVAIGTSVEVEDLDTGRRERYRVVGKHEPLRPGELSAASAIGDALLGRRSGDAVTVELPNRHVRRLQVVASEPTRGAEAPAS
jgi:transcription elongation factor GreA